MIRRVCTSPGVWIVLALCVVINVVATRHDVRADLTRDGLYTLSAPSARVVEQASAPIHVEVFLSRDLPPPLHNTSQQLADLLDEYAHASKGKLSYSIHLVERGDPAPAQQKCEETALTQRTSDSMSVRAVYRCVVFMSEERRHVIPALPLTGQPEIDDLEFEITRGLLALTQERTQRLGIITGLGGPSDVPDFVRTAKGVFQELYQGRIEPVAIDLSADTPRISPEIDAVVLLDLETPLSDNALFALDQHVQRGGGLGWFQSASVPDRELIAQLSKTLGKSKRIPPVYRAHHDKKLTDLVASYGVRHRHDMILDPERAMTSTVWTQKGVTQAQNPAVFRVDELDRRLGFLRHTSMLVLPTPSSLEVLAQPSSTLEISIAAQSSDLAQRVATPLETRTYEAVIASLDSSERGGPYALAVTLQGTFPSYYEEHPLPQGITQQDLYDGPPEPARLLVVGSGDLILPQPAFGYDKQLAEQAQQLFFQSSEWLLQDDVLSQLRDRRAPDILKPVDATTRWRVKWLNIVIVPLCFVLFGYAMILRRRWRQDKLSEPT